MKSFLPGIIEYISDLDLEEIPSERKGLLDPILTHIQEKVKNHLDINLLFICAHNARRSQIAQAWSVIAADYFGLQINSYSGGVEVTEVSPHIIQEFENMGCSVLKGKKFNPKYALYYSFNKNPITLFSKHYDDRGSIHEFSTIYVCSEEEDNCPQVLGSEAQFQLPYEDPSEYDQAENPEELYEDIMKQIALEMGYIFSHVQK